VRSGLVGLVAALGLGVCSVGLVPISAAEADGSCAEWNENMWAVGLPREGDGRGGLQVGSALFDVSSVGLPPLAPGDQFGASLSPFYAHDGDKCLDLAVGAPGAEGTGAVYVLRGSPDGFASAYMVRLVGAARGDRFGASVSGGVVGYVVAGAPGRNVGRVADAGAISWFVAGADGPLAPPVEVSQASPGISGAPEVGDQFGEVLSPAFHDMINEVDPPEDPPIVEVGVFVGVPHEDIGRAKNAGMVAHLNITTELDSSLLRQGVGGISGRPETGDRFGAALTMHTHYLSYVADGGLAVGVPGEDIGGVRDAGAVGLAYFVDSGGQASAKVELGGWKGISQNSDGLPGRSEAGDAFGAAVTATGDNCVRDGVNDPFAIGGARFAIGAPGEDAVGARNAGTVTLYDYNGYLEGTSPCVSTTIEQQRLGSGRSERGDHFGASLASKRNGDLAIAVPGEDSSSVIDAGRVVYASFLSESTLVFNASETAPNGPQADLRYATLWQY
jgi:hypothetical protein